MGTFKSQDMFTGENYIKMFVVSLCEFELIIYLFINIFFNF